MTSKVTIVGDFQSPRSVGKATAGDAGVSMAPNLKETGGGAITHHNPLTKKGRKILRSMKDQYGEEKGRRVFYASANAGRITGVHK